MSYNRETYRNVNRTLKAALAEAGLYQHEAATRLGIPRTTFNMKALGRRKFTEDERKQLAEILDKPVEVLFPDTISSCVIDTQEESAGPTRPRE